MIVSSKNFVLKLEEIIKDHLPTKTYNESENTVLGLIHRWHSGKNSFIHQTSGSTGKPKNIEIARAKIELSARQTMSYLDKTNSIGSSLLCLNPNSIGGAMVVYRALIFNHNLRIVEPSATPLDALSPKETFDIVSMVPMQFGLLTDEQIKRFKVILIGGAPMPIQNNFSDTQIYSTYGMTETVSHIALRSIDEEYFHTTGDTIVESQNATMRIKGSITDHLWLETNDIIECKSKTSFKWIGRSDFVINSGGIKIHPEALERKLRDQINSEFIASSLPDEKLGNKLILIIEGEPQELDFSQLNRYHRPKEWYFRQSIAKTASGKIDRNKTLQKLNTSK